MKLDKILDKLGSLEKNSFIKIIDNIIGQHPKNSQEIEKILSTADKGLKSVDSENVARIFSLIEDEFMSYLSTEFQDATNQLDILIDIVSKDGNCIMKEDWFSRLYEREIKKIKKKAKQFSQAIKDEKGALDESRKRDYNIYHSCLSVAYNNDLQNNLEAKITSDELSILVTLADRLGLSQEEVKLINYTIIPIELRDINAVVQSLKNIGIIFFSKKENTVYVADEMVRMLRRLREKRVANKFYRRTLKLLRPSVINQIARRHNIERNLSTAEKIEEIINEGVSFTSLLSSEIHKDGTTLNEKKKALNELCEKGLGIKNLKGTVLEDKIESLINYFENVERDEKLGMSFDGYEKLLGDLNASLPGLNSKIKNEFELQHEFVLKAEILIDYNLKPRDIIDLVDKDELKIFMSEQGISNRGDDVLNCLDHYKDTDNLYLENYSIVGYRDLNKLKENGIQIKEADLGIKFEELTKTIFTGLGLNVNEGLRKTINTKKDLIDILIDLGNDEVIIVECKTSKEKGYNKFSAVSRQLKAYQKLVDANNLRITKILLVAPEFSDDFVTDVEMDVEMNLSLITAGALYNIFEAFKDSKYEVFPHVLLRDIVINEGRIIKALNK